MAASSSPLPMPFSMPLSLRIALRELRGGLKGFYVFLACVALGVASIAAIGSLAGAMKSGIAQEGQTILGGDFEASINHRRATPKERAFLATKGTISEVATLRAMARSNDAKRQTLIAIRAVDNIYPLYGKVDLKGAGNFQNTIVQPIAAVVDPLLLERLGVKQGDTIRIGTGDVRIAALIKNEPDRLSDRVTFGPRILMSVETLEKTGLAAPGSLVKWAYRIRFPENVNAAREIKNLRAEIKEKFAGSGFNLRDSSNPAPMTRRAISRMSLFLTLVGLTALIVGGVGVANGVATYLDRKRKVIAAFKCLGASSSLIAKIYFWQVFIIAATGIALGLFLGAIVPWAFSLLVQDALPFSMALIIQPSALLLAALFGFIVSFLFVLWPLGRAQQVKPQVLMRDIVVDGPSRPPLFFILASLALGLLLAVIAIASADVPFIAAYFCAGIIVFFVIFFALGSALQKVFRLLPRPKKPELAVALTNLSGPGALTRSVVLSLGTGLSLLVAVALVDRSLVSELKSGLPNNAPNYFFLDIGKEKYQAFEAHVKRAIPEGHLNQAPMLRGRIVTLGGRAVEDIKAAPNAQWVLNGDRGLTYAEELPEGSQVVEGEWWPKNYSGKPLVSFEKDIAIGLGVKMGDEVTVNVLGRNVTAHISNLRTVKWESLSINFVMVFSPNTLASAPFNMLATLHVKDDPEASGKGSFVQSIAEAFPGVTVIRVRDTIEAINEILSKLMLGIRAAGGLTLIAGSLVLAGALATAHRKRIYQAVILKTLGATRRRIITAHLAEYLILALVTSVFAAALGTAAAWITVTKIMDFSFSFSPWAVMQAIGIAVLLVVIFGVAGSWSVLSAKASPALRNAA